MSWYLGEDDRRLPEGKAEEYLGYPRGRLRQRREQGLPPYPVEVEPDERTAYYRLGELRRYARGGYALGVGDEPKAGTA